MIFISQVSMLQSKEAADCFATYFVDLPNNFYEIIVLTIIIQFEPKYLKHSVHSTLEQFMLKAVVAIPIQAAKI